MTENSHTEHLSVDLDLLKRYDRPGPRYTSYPSAAQFTEAFDQHVFTRAIQKSNMENPPSNISLYLHIPFCPQLCYFCACTTIISQNQTRIENYLADIHREIKLLVNTLDSDRYLSQVHLGGGTPSYLKPDQLRRLFTQLHRHFIFHDDAEIGLEIDPRGVNDDDLNAIEELGINRASLGVQDFEPAVQEAINRIQPEGMTRSVFNGLRERGVRSINIDLIYGLPLQTLNSFSHTLDRIIDIAPDRIALFNYAHVPWLKKHQRIIKKSELPCASTKLGILKQSIERLNTAGYRFIGMDHFAKTNDPLVKALEDRTLCRNFQGYSTQGNCELYGVGMSSISQLHHCYAQNHKDLTVYSQAIAKGRLATQRGYHLDRDDRIRRHIIMNLMCRFNVSIPTINAEFGIDFDHYFQSSLTALKQCEADGLIQRSNTDLTVTTTGRLFIRNIAMCFDRYLVLQGQDRPLYSRTV